MPDGDRDTAVRFVGATQRHESGCFPAAIASVLEAPVELLPDVDHDAADWLGDYNRKLAEGGWPFMLISAPPNAYVGNERVPHYNHRRWIAVVPRLSGKPGHHAVVMGGNRLLWDPSDTAKYQRVEMDQIKYAWLLVVTGPGWGPGRNPGWEPKELCA